MSSSSGPKEAPFHVLMSTERPLQEMLVRDDRLQNDYLTRRFRCLYDGSNQEDIWSAATPLERALSECCELDQDEEDDSIIRGALVKGKEGAFVRLLALHCHTPSTRALALAILQRTIEQDELEEGQEELTNDEDHDEKSAGHAETKPDGDKSEKPLPESAKDKDKDCNEKSVKTNSQQQAKKSEKLLPESPENVEEEATEDDDDDDDDVGRMGRFLAAGGLKILKQWLEDAMTPIKTVVPEAPPQAATTKKEASRVVVQIVTSPTGPLLRPLLTVLTDMPFDKNLTRTVKINKQIRNLKKQLDEAIASRKAKKGEDKWTDPVAGGLVVVEVRQMVEALMKRWEERNKTSTLVTQDPFESIRETMRERLDVLTKYEAGEISKPTWLEVFEEKERQAKEQEELSKMTTEQRAARERQQEREQMLKRVQKKQTESKAKRELLLKTSREESQKRKVEGSLGGDGKRARRVRWKDGLENSANFKRRSLLEQVYVYPNDKDPSNGSNLKQEPHDENNRAANVKQESDEDEEEEDDDCIIPWDTL